MSTWELIKEAIKALPEPTDSEANELKIPKFKPAKKKAKVMSDKAKDGLATSDVTTTNQSES